MRSVIIVPVAVEAEFVVHDELMISVDGIVETVESVRPWSFEDWSRTERVVIYGLAQHGMVFVVWNLDAAAANWEFVSFSFRRGIKESLTRHQHIPVVSNGHSVDVGWHVWEVFLFL
jgi:hypothetical protein